MAKKAQQEIQIRFVPSSDPEFGARRQKAIHQLIDMLARQLVDKALAEHAARKDQAEEPRGTKGGTRKGKPLDL